MQQTTPETVRHVFIPMKQHLTEEASAKNPTVFYACGRNHMQNRKGLRTIFLTEMEMLRARRQSIRVSKNDGRIHCFPRKIERPFPDEISGKDPPLPVQQARLWAHCAFSFPMEPVHLLENFGRQQHTSLIYIADKYKETVQDGGDMGTIRKFARSKFPCHPSFHNAGL
ncbi:hypothetical protein PTHTG4_01730 [Parageobacillus thermoglucosidasius]|nr:hypothetical protein PTHTG4_01730 [Parageobacillus thermoglucosidasius]